MRKWDFCLTLTWFCMYLLTGYGLVLKLAIVGLLSQIKQPRLSIPMLFRFNRPRLFFSSVWICKGFFFIYLFISAVTIFHSSIHGDLIEGSYVWATKWIPCSLTIYSGIWSWKSCQVLIPSGFSFTWCT